jgi:repressor LexA|nr:MAG TPA: LexA repressor [Caudoviricetes sp.]
MNNVVSDRIKKAIEKSGYSFVELEKRTGVSKSALQRYSQGVTTKVPVDVVNAIGDATGISPFYLIGWGDDPNYYPDSNSRKNSIPLYSSLCCGKGLFINDNIEDYIAVPDRYINSNKEYFANIAKGDSMIGKGINEGDTLIFEKTNVLESGQIGSFCINDGNDCVCKTFRKLNNGMIVLESANPKYDPIIIDVTNECFRVIGKLICKFSSVE